MTRKFDIRFIHPLFKIVRYLIAAVTFVSMPKVTSSCFHHFSKFFDLIYQKCLVDNNLTVPKSTYFYLQFREAGLLVTEQALEVFDFFFADPGEAVRFLCSTDPVVSPEPVEFTIQFFIFCSVQS